MDKTIDSEVGKVPFDANLVPLDECIDLIIDHRGKTPKKMGSDWVDSGIPVISAKNVHKGFLTHQDEIRFVTKEVYKKWMSIDVEIGDCILVSEGATLGEYLYWNYDFPVVLGQRLFCIRTNPKKLYNRYFYSYMTTQYFQNQVYGRASGTSVSGLRQTEVRNLIIPIIPIERQKRIGDFVFNINEKIDLLHRQNQKLEELAEILYRQWFVLEANPEGDEVFLSDVADHHKKNIKPFENPFQEYFHYSIPAFDDGQNPQIELGETVRSNKYQVLTNSILISKLNPRFPRVWQISKPIDEEVSICSTEFQVVVPHEQRCFPFIYYFLKSRPVTDELIGAAGGTSGSHQRVSPDDIFNLSFIKPNDARLSQFHQIVSPNLEKINNNREQILKLEKLRNTLLPKLMSGEVRVKMKA